MNTDAAHAEITDRQRRHWDAVADGWAKWLSWTERNFEPLTMWLRRAAAWEPGVRVLDIGSGSGYPALAAAAHVRPGGAVVGIDLSPAMVASAARRAEETGIENVEFLEANAEALPFADGSFDAVTCACVLMFCPDPRRAMAEIHRVLRPGGRFAIVVWDEPARSPFLTVFGGVAAAFFSQPPPPDPSAPGPFRFAPSGELEAILLAAAWSAVVVERVEMPFELASVREYCQLFQDVTARPTSRMARMSEEDAARFAASVAKAVEPYRQAGRLRLNATALCASGRK